MKYIKISLSLLLSVALISSCKHDKSLFVNPNNPTTATPQTLLTAAEVGTFNTYEGDLTRTAGVLVQQGYGAGGQATSTQVYSLPQSLFDNQWSQIYQTLETIQLLKSNFGANNPYYAGIADVLMAMNWGVATDLWGDIPYTQALNINVYPTPAYDSQAVVMQGILNLLDSAISLLSNTSAVNAFTPGTDDVIFGGATSNWVATAYTLKARYLNRYSNKSSYSASAVLSCITNGIQSSAGDCMAIHGPNAQESNQWYAYLQSRAYIDACATIVDSVLLDPNDLRIYYYFDTTGWGGIYGDPVNATSGGSAPYWGSYLAASGATSTPLVTYFEALFIQAEADFRAGNLSNAAADLNNAIVANCNKVTGGVYSGADRAVYTSSNVSLSRIMYEKWIAMFGQIEVYNDYRRTGFPNLTPNSLGAISVIPKRYPTPDQESNNNPNAKIQSLTTPVWWAE